ncbi:alanine acetyltransferase [Lysobacter auxotrophicus]|uniref:Alanine acetyltransferase n=1 Tax=Lysobacter auxotrophicus TaxID=2992573 RepID=A0ABM8DAC1_9GAMM|nr:alanine acetyltransferase [Lysobacter auxotrophicus]BDU15488.1 alanine acetyltransferase [Lysobacter auxotrophicus]
MSEPWTAEQREWLQAMGHTVWSVAPADALAAEREPDTRGADASASSGPRGAMREAAALLARDERPARPAPVQARSAAARPAPGRPAGDRLTHALLRAAGGVDKARVMELVGDIAALRGNAAAKRALWPRLRALRRESRG